MPVPRATIVVPVFDEAECIALVLDELRATLADAEAYEIVVVDDGSRDATPQLLEAAKARLDGLRLLRHAVRRGKSAALRTGVNGARAQVVVTVDGDGQNDPADIPRLLAEFAADPDAGLVAGERRERHDDLLRRWSSALSNRVRAAVLNDGARDSACGLKAFPRDVFLALPFFEGMHRFLPALVRRAGRPVRFLGVGHRPRLAGRAKYGAWDRLWVGLRDLLHVARMKET